MASSKAALFSATAFALVAQVNPVWAAEQTSGSGSASASPVPTAQLEEVVVTAQRSEQNLQRVSAPVSAISGEAITRAGVTTATGLTKVVPAVQISQASGAYTVFFLRGVGSNATNSLTDPAVAVAYNDVFITRPFATGGPFFDLQRVEVVRGPQGTLYGRNATAGAVNIIPKKPTFDFGGDFGLTYGNYNTVIANGAVNLPLAERTAVRVAFQTERHDGYVSDGTGDADNQAARVLLLSKPTEDLTIELGADYFHQGGKGGGYVLISNGFRPSDRIGITDPRAQAYLISQGFAPINGAALHNDNQIYGFSARVDWRTPLGTLTVIPAYRRALIDTLATQPLLYADGEKDSQTSLEARLASPIGDKLHTIVGTYLLDDHDNTVAQLGQLSNAAGGGSRQIFQNKTGSKAVFADGTYSITDTVRVLGGVRYTEDRKSVNGVLTSLAYPNLTPTGTITLNASKNFSATTWRAGFEWDVAPRSLVYATVATGFHSGGFFFTNDNPAYNPEKITAYTLGSKNRFFDGRMQANFELYDWQYRDQQISHITTDSKGKSVFATENAGQSRARGADVELNLLVTPDTLIGGQVQYLDAKLTRFSYRVPFPASPAILCTRTVAPPFTVDCSGMRPPQAPEWTFNGTLQQTFHLPNTATLVATADVHYQSSTITAVNYLPNDFQPGYTTADLSLTYAPEDRRWGLTAFVNNVGDKAVVAYTQHLSSLVATGAGLRPPRTYGVRLQAHF